MYSNKSRCPLLNFVSYTFLIIDTDGFTVNEYYTGQTMITLSINWIHFFCPSLLNEPLLHALHTK